jgi:hypothetical protein
MKLGVPVSFFFSIGAALAPGCGGAFTFATPGNEGQRATPLVESEKS